MPYTQAIGSLMYTVLGSCPDIAFAVQQLSQHTHDFSQAHWTAVKHVIHYLKGTHDAGIVLHHSTSTPLIEIYSNADFTGLADSHSVGGFLCKYHGCIVTWVSKKQPQIALSTTKSESMALIPGAKHALWISHFLQELSLPLAALIHIHCDNMQTISNLWDTSHHPCTKHFCVEGHWLQELIDCGDTIITYVKSTDNVADILTKALLLAQHKFLFYKLGML